MPLAPVTTNGHASGAPEQMLQDGTLIDCNIAELHYGKFKAVRDVALKVKKGTITAFIGPSGCGKSTVLRCLNRMNDLVRGFRFKGHVIFRGQDIYASRIDPVAVRRHIGMVFQQPNPFAMSIFRNVAFGLRLNRYKGTVAEKVEQALRRPRCGTRSRTSCEPAACALRRTAAAAVHRARHRHRAGGAADGRAVLGARSDRDAPDRGADEGAEEEVHHRHRDAQSAAGQAGRRHDRLSVRGHFRRAAAPAIWSSTGRPRRSSRIPRKSTPRIISAASSVRLG